MITWRTVFKNGARKFLRCAIGARKIQARIIPEYGVNHPAVCTSVFSQSPCRLWISVESISTSAAIICVCCAYSDADTNGSDANEDGDDGRPEANDELSACDVTEQNYAAALRRAAYRFYVRIRECPKPVRRVFSDIMRSAFDNNS